MNIVDIIKDIKDCPLYCTLFGEVICNINNTAIEVKAGRMCTTLDKEGKHSPQGECILFPSKDQRDWSKFDRYLIDTSMMCSDNKKGWMLRYYAGNRCVFVNDETSKDDAETIRFKYMIPATSFNFRADCVESNVCHPNCIIN